MITKLTGSLTIQDTKTVIIETNGVGYEVVIDPTKVTNKKKTSLWIHSHIKEDSFTLYGFKDLNDRSMFRMLLQVNGVGPTTASVLASKGVFELIKLGDVKGLVKINGVGTATAQNLVDKLQSKII